MIKTDFNKYTSKFITLADKTKLNRAGKNIIKSFNNGDLSYWNDINSFVTREELSQIIEVANYVRDNCDVFIVIGIGGSYMGSKALIEALLPSFNRNHPEIIFLGTNLSSDYYKEVIEYIKDKNVIVNVISKSGETLEPNIAFSIIKYIMEGKYNNEELRDRIIVTTDAKKGSLRKLANDNGYFTFDIPSKIGGRFSALTPVGLFPLAVMGIDILNLLEGFIDASTYNDDAINYAITREALFRKKKYVEAFTVYDEKLYYFTEWLKQLFAETQGKSGKGILPISIVNTRDLHSMGQFLQQGNDIVFETVIGVEKASVIKVAKYDKTLHEINRIAEEKVCIAHYSDKTPSLVIHIEELDEYNMGELMHFFIVAAIAGALLINVNPFDQPGVQKYKELINEGINNIFIF